MKHELCKLFEKKGSKIHCCIHELFVKWASGPKNGSSIAVLTLFDFHASTFIYQFHICKLFTWRIDNAPDKQQFKFDFFPSPSENNVLISIKSCARRKWKINFWWIWAHFIFQIQSQNTRTCCGVVEQKTRYGDEKLLDEHNQGKMLKTHMNCQSQVGFVIVAKILIKFLFISCVFAKVVHCHSLATDTHTHCPMISSALHEQTHSNSFNGIESIACCSCRALCHWMCRRYTIYSSIFDSTSDNKNCISR